MEYLSSNSGENALIVEKKNVTITNINVTKTGDSDGDSSDFYGTNAAIFCYNDGILTINGGKIATNGSHANGVFAYNSGVINISDAIINTSSNNSGAVMVTGGGTLSANNVTATTEGNSSAPIRSDRGGGTLTVNGGTYTSNGIGSPAVYSTANITINDASLISNKSEGVVVEGANSVSLSNVKLTDTNTTLNGNSETYKNIFLYQSMSGDASEGNASFSSKGSTITTNKGDTIFVTNTTATIDLENNNIINNDETGAFLRVQSGKWGTSGKNGGDVTLNLKKQEVKGDIYIDSISSLDLKLTEGSSLTSCINKEKVAKTINLSLDKTSSLVLTGDSYVTNLNNELSDNSNINLNGYTLYVGDSKITSTNYVKPEVENSEETISNESNIASEDEIVTIVNEEKEGLNVNLIIIISVAAFVIVLIIVIVLILKKRKK